MAKFTTNGGGFQLFLKISTGLDGGDIDVLLF
jgi:hypothetical protein